MFTTSEIWMHLTITDRPHFPLLMVHEIMVHLRITAFELMFLSWVCSSENEAVGALNGPLWGLPPLVGLMRTWLNLLMTLSHLFPAWSSLFSLGESSEGF